MVDPEKLSLPADRAFVVQLHAEAKIEHGQVHGRVEHIVSYQATRFTTLAELLAFMARVLKEQQE
ncbi:MAG: hypothetical protein HOP18_11375 [Deltaproteobacteria bacterium]|nr:hypothetical protein [Deltaproteobacteria bacterium]